MTPDQRPSPERVGPRNRFFSKKLEAPPVRFVQEITDRQGLDQYAADKSSMAFGGATKVVKFDPDSPVELIADTIRTHTRIVPVGGRTAVTGAASPDNEVVLDMAGRNKILEWGEAKDGVKTIKVQTGIKISALKEALERDGFYYPPAPTYEDATVGGTIGTNAAGAATFKYGQTRDWVEGLTVILPNGELLDINRGDCVAKNGRFEWQDADGNVHNIQVPTYRMPNVRKLAAGYYAKPDMDLVDLFVGAEGTLGVVTEARLRVIDKPKITWAMIPVDSEEKALALTARLRERAKQAWTNKDPNGLDVSAIEYIDEKSLDLLREDSSVQHGILPPPEAKTLLLVQMEMNGENTENAEQHMDAFYKDKFPHLRDQGDEDIVVPDSPLTRFLRELDDTTLDTIEVATPDKKDRIQHFIDMREAVPGGVNRRVVEKKNEEIASRGETTISKTAGDMIVPFRFLPDMMSLFRERFSEEYDMYIWGHVSDGNMHVNIVPKSSEQSSAAREILMECGKIVIDEYEGSPCSEHGVGKNPVKQALVGHMYKLLGIGQMREVRRVFDPNGKMPQNILALAA